jgi:hypothetical protein
MYQRRKMGAERVGGGESGLGTSGLWGCEKYANREPIDMYQR